MDKEKRVLVTGATGFVGAHVVDQLLKNGYFVRATARSQQKADHIISLYQQYKESLEFVIVPDLSNLNAFDGVLEGLAGVFHIASPTAISEFKSMDEDIIVPAVNGTLSILNEALKTPSIKRIVFTSSIACVVDFHNGHEGYVYSEKDFNPIALEEEKKGITDATTGYISSKCYSEKAAWEFIKKHNPHFDITVLCPPMIYGPILHHIDTLSEVQQSLRLLYDQIAGKFEIGPFPVDLFIDVRDLAIAERITYESPAAANQRIIVSHDENYTWQEVVDFAQKHFPNRIRAVGNPGVYPPVFLKVSTEKAKAILGMLCRPKHETFYDNIAQLLEFEDQGL